MSGLLLYFLTNLCRRYRFASFRLTSMMLPLCYLLLTSFNHRTKYKIVTTGDEINSVPPRDAAIIRSAERNVFRIATNPQMEMEAAMW